MYFDKTCKGNLTRLEAQEMFIDYACFVAVILPMIGAGELSIETIQWYQRGMARNMSDVIATLMDIFFPPRVWNIDRQSFLDTMCKKENQELLSSSGFREFVLKNGSFARRD